MKNGRSRLTLLVSTAVIVMSLTSSYAQNLLLNASFESGNFIQDWYFRDRMRLPNGSTQIEHWVVGKTGSGEFSWLRASSYNPQHGNRAIDLDSNSNMSTYIQQSFSTVIGQRYEVSAYFSSEANAGPAATGVYINSDRLGIVTVGSGSGSGSYWPNLIWTRQSFSFTATSTVSTLRFQDETTSGNWNSLVDNASVVVVPEPTLASLLGLGVLAAAMRSRKS